MPSRSSLGLTVLAASWLSLAGCGGTGTIDADEIASQVSDQLEAEVGQRPDSVDCPDDLAAEVGAMTRCELTAGEDTLGVSVTVTAVDGDNVSLDIQVDG